MPIKHYSKMRHDISINKTKLTQNDQKQGKGQTID